MYFLQIAPYEQLQQLERLVDVDDADFEEAQASLDPEEIEQESSDMKRENALKLLEHARALSETRLKNV